MKRILVACGNGIATSTMVVMKIKRALEENGLQATITQCKLMEIPSKESNQDVIVATGKYDNPNITKPVINAISLLSGVGADKTIAEIISFIKED